MNTYWLSFSELLKFELKQCSEEGKNIDGYSEKIDKILSIDEYSTKEMEAGILLDEMYKLPVVNKLLKEPSDWDGILGELKIDKLQSEKIPYSNEELLNRVHGAWVGRCGGCLLGKPFEGSKIKTINNYYKMNNDKFPVFDYFSSDKAGNDEFLKTKQNLSIDKLDGMPVDDDTNYTALSLRILDEVGRDFTTEDVGEAWFKYLPLYEVHTAERITYRNLANLILPPNSASYRNSCREWIGAQIRIDLFGYINPANPLSAAKMAFTDAALSHVKNGIYGAMMLAAMISKAFVSTDIMDIIDIGLYAIPQKSRLYMSITESIKWFEDGMSWSDAIKKVHSLWDENDGHDWCHTISNAVIVVLALLYGKNDYEKTIGFALLCGFDTDCNCATAGSIHGAMFGLDKLPEKFVKPLNDTLHTGITGYGKISISQIAKETMKYMSSPGN